MVLVSRSDDCGTTVARLRWSRLLSSGESYVDPANPHRQFVEGAGEPCLQLDRRSIGLWSLTLCPGMLRSTVRITADRFVAFAPHEVPLAQSLPLMPTSHTIALQQYERRLLILATFVPRSDTTSAPYLGQSG
jgi:hypothetical protein